MGDRRATAVDEKAARRQMILAVAGELLGLWSYGDITMDRIAGRAGLAKGTLYLYFPTKESLFLELYEERLGAWYGELESLASQVSGAVTRFTAARAIASTLAARPILLRLHALLCSTLGHTIDHATFRAFRLRHAQRIASVAPSLANRIEGMSERGARRLLVRLEAVTGGLAGATELSKTFSHTPQEADLEVFGLDFEEELRSILAALLG